MNELIAFLQHPLALTLGWSLLHFLWQGALIAAGYTLVRTVCPRAPASVQYGISCGALLLLLLFPLGTFLYLYEVPADPAAPVAHSAAPTTKDALAQASAKKTITPVATPPLAPTITNWPQTPWYFHQRLALVLPWLIGLWSLGVGLLSFRLLGGWAQLQYIKATGLPTPDPIWQQSLADLSRRLGIRRPLRLLESIHASVPMAVGWWRPALLVPVGMLAGLPYRQVEAILLHELAHIRRYDYLVNVGQLLMETFFFYHPAVWWISARIRIEREYCCDDLAASACGDTLTYARALTALQAQRVPLAALAATDGPLLDRIKRLVQGYSPLPARPGLILSLVPLVVLLGILLQSEPSTAHSMAFERAALETPHDDEAVDWLIEELGNSNPTNRQNAAWALKIYGDNRAIDPLIATLQDKDTMVRVHAIWSLYKLGGSRAVEPLIALLNDPDKEVRFWAVRGLGELGDHRGLEPLVAALGDPDPSVRRETATYLRRFEAPQALDPLVAILREDGIYARWDAAQTLGMLKNPRAAEPLLKALFEDEEPLVYKAAATALGQLEAPQSVDQLLEALEDDDPQTQDRAALALGEIGDLGTIEPLQAILRLEGQKADAVPLRAQVVQALGKFGDPALLEQLWTIAQDHSEEKTVRKAAIAGIGGSLDPGATQRLIDAMASEEKTLRTEAVRHLMLRYMNTYQELYSDGMDHDEALRATRDLLPASPSMVNTLIKALDDQREDVRFFAARTLGWTGDSLAVESLITLLKPPCYNGCWGAFLALGSLNDPRAVEPIIALLQEPDINHADQLISVLGRFGDRRAIEPLAAILADDNHPNRWNAAEALGSIADKQVMKPLRMALSDEDIQVKQAAFTAVRKLRVAAREEQHHFGDGH